MQNQMTDSDGSIEKESQSNQSDVSTNYWHVVVVY
jgi:hypothetical protein